MDDKYCQSCAMPMGASDDLYGIEPNGTKSSDYCSHCYEKGEFTFKGTMDELIEICIPHVVQAHAGMIEEDARKEMQGYFPQLKRWK